MKGDVGYLSDEPCRICGKVNQNEMHHKYGYVVCEDHKHVPPHKIPPLEPTKKKINKVMVPSSKG